MKALLLARAACVLALTTTLAGGVGASAFAQTTATPATPNAASAPAAAASSGGPSSGAAATGSTGAAAASAPTHHTTTTRTKRAASRAPETMAQMAEQRISDLHARLKITAAQQSQWDQFAQVMRDNAKDLDAAYQQRAASFDKMNAVENMQSYAQIEQTRAQDMQKLVPAFQTLYTSLTDPQKQQADMLFRNQAARSTQRHAAAATH